MKKITQKYSLAVDAKQISAKIEAAKQSAKNINPEALKQCFNSIDLTTLNAADTISQVKKMAEKVSNFSNVYRDLPNVSAICVYPALVNTVRKYLTDKKVNIASVAAGFPASQTFVDVKIKESILAIENGADEIDIVISIGRFLEQDYDFVYEEIEQIKKAIGNIRLKVILETGALKDLQLIRTAALLAMEAGADFIKTSTGKFYDAATPEAVCVMCEAIGDYKEQSGRLVGIKPSGGISTAAEAIVYYNILKLTLGESWLNSKLFRIGASRLANNLLTEIVGLEAAYF
ncbi:MAG: deoxyribose-phosphate aldolase [Prevotellaceae bacterium]|jgi:deoxyribose-phosphate aldolase|nr:deoxyribose-phosphate aldolase [Prevotellaceae bacterium]